MALYFGSEGIMVVMNVGMVMVMKGGDHDDDTPTRDLLDDDTHCHTLKCLSTSHH